MCLIECIKEEYNPAWERLRPAKKRFDAKFNAAQACRKECDKEWGSSSHNNPQSKGEGLATAIEKLILALGESGVLP